MVLLGLGLLVFSLVAAFRPLLIHDDNQAQRLELVVRQAGTVEASLRQAQAEGQRWQASRDPMALLAQRTLLTLAAADLGRLRDLASAQESLASALQPVTALLPASPPGQPSTTGSAGEFGAPLGPFTVEQSTALRQAILSLRQVALTEAEALLRQEYLILWAMTALPALAGLLLLGFALLRHDQGEEARRLVYRAGNRAVREAALAGSALVDHRLRLLRGDARLATMQGRDLASMRGAPVIEALPGLAPGLLPLLQRALAGGEALGPRELSGPAPGGRMARWAVSVQPIRDGGGRVLAAAVAVVDVTSRAEAEAAHERTTHELNHRVKNTLATVQALAAQTLRVSGEDPSRFRQQFASRLQALARSHDLLSAAGWGPVPVRGAVLASLGAPLQAGQVMIEGEGEGWLRPPQVQALVLAMQELLDNACRHGVLAGTPAEGHVWLRWSLSEDGAARLTWSEEMPPHARPASSAEPSREGFGLRLLRRAVPQDLGPGTTVDLRFRPEGLLYTLTFQAMSASEAWVAPQEALFPPDAVLSSHRPGGRVA